MIGYHPGQAPQRRGSGVHADVIVDGILPNTVGVETGTKRMRGEAAFTITTAQ
jgi:hypothetical protein